jgi:formylglycine-generating enzyme required for sulfatase activity
MTIIALALAALLAPAPPTPHPMRITHKASGIAFVLIPAGEFTMGSPEGEWEHEKNEQAHKQVIESPFFLGETEVTVGQFRKFVEATGYITDAEHGVDEGGHGKGAYATTPDGGREWSEAASWRNPFPNLPDFRVTDDLPVVQVSWNDAQAFAKHYGLTLPTEAQWEYAVRAGTTTPFFWGSEPAGAKGYGNFQDASGRKRFSKWNTSFPFDDGYAILAPVGSFKANAWGIKDLEGNVSEWCLDAWGDDARHLRGAAWLDAPFFARSAKRIGFAPQGRRDMFGFRVAMPAAVGAR